MSDSLGTFKRIDQLFTLPAVTDYDLPYSRLCRVLADAHIISLKIYGQFFQCGL